MSVLTSENVLGQWFTVIFPCNCLASAKITDTTARTVRVGGRASGKILGVNEAAAACFVNQTKSF